jgi:hypothetical protein
MLQTIFSVRAHSAFQHFPSAIDDYGMWKNTEAIPKAS